MTIDEAIKKLGEVKQLRVPTGELDELRSCNLGIEALKRWKERHGRCPDDINFLLPGETQN